MGLFDRFKKKPEPEQQKPTDKTDDVITRLDELGYFKYVDPAHLDQVKAEQGKGLAEYHGLTFIDGGPPKYEGIDPRFYWLDNEDLFEQDGFIDKLAEMTPLFAKMNIKMDVTDHVEDWENETGLNHRISLNGKPYLIFENWEGYGWGEAAQRFADMINHQLMLQHSDERLYLINGGNDGQAVFLTGEQYKLIRTFTTSKNESPLPTKEWCDAMQVTWENIIPQE